MNKKRVLAIIAIVAIVAIMTVCLCACNAESITKKLEKKGYAVESVSDAETAWIVVAKKGVTEYVTVAKFNKTADAKDMEKNAPTGKEGGFEVVCKRVGNVVFYGTKQGVKDAM